MRRAFEVPVTSPTRKKGAFLEPLRRKYPRMVQWFLTVFEKEGLNFRDVSLNGARTTVKELCYPTRKRRSKYNCKGAVSFPHSHFYDTAITEAIQKWSSFLTWKERRGTAKRFPRIRSYAPVFDSTMFDLDLGRGWITLRTSRGQSIHIPVTVPNKSHYGGLDEGRVGSIRLKRHGGLFVFLLTQKSRSPERPSPEELGEHPLIGVDLGERDLASLVVVRRGRQRPGIGRAEFFDGAEAKELEHREHHLRKKLQKRGKSREIPRRKWRAKNKRRATCEEIGAKIGRIAEEAGAKAAFIGDLRAPRPKNFGVLSRRLSNYPFARLKESIKRHLEKEGIFVKLVYEGRTGDELGTSQKCHECGAKGERRGGRFSCPACGLEYNADLNASINIVERGAKSLGMTGGLGAVP